jgi:hypothetical protein
VEQLLLELMRKLEVVGDRDESLYDSVVREKMGNPIFYLFVKPTAGYVMPDNYGVSEGEDRLIKAALREYVEGALALAPQLGLNTFHERLAAFQQEEARTEGGNYYDDFFGWSDPAVFDESGNVIRQR